MPSLISATILASLFVVGASLKCAGGVVTEYVLNEDKANGRCVEACAQTTDATARSVSACAAARSLDGANANLDGAILDGANTTLDGAILDIANAILDGAWTARRLDGANATLGGANATRPPQPPPAPRSVPNKMNLTFVTFVDHDTLSKRRYAPSLANTACYCAAHGYRFVIAVVPSAEAHLGARGKAALKNRRGLLALT
jgi:hypothetical protein